MDTCTPMAGQMTFKRLAAPLILYILEIRLKERKGKYPDRGNQRDLRKGNHRIVIKLLF
jgi:hypothetical protein